MQALGLCIFLFVVGWAKFGLDQPWIYAGDYSLRLVIILCAIQGLSRRYRALNLPDIKIGGLALISSIILLYFNGLYENIDFVKGLNSAFFETVSFPLPESKWLLGFDFTLGLFLVALSEELVFRGLFVSLAEKWRWSDFKLYFMSSLIFGLIHLPQGIVNVFTGVLWGLLLMYLYKRSRSLWFVVVIHYLVDVWFFGLDWLWS